MAIYKFQPLLKQTLWGGERIAAFKHIDTPLTNIGESWELSAVPGDESTVSEGPDAGTTLGALVRRMKERLVGRENYQRFGDDFPLLIKFIDARQDLSIQVHPNDEVAHRHGRLHGKTEMWYVISPPTTSPTHPTSSPTHPTSSPTPTLYCGLKQHITPEKYRQMVESDTITDALARYEVHPDDVFFIPAGRIHAIGAGCFVAEIQQTSDVTYRIYDFKRRDKDGNYRQLHTAQAAEAIDYTVLDDYRTVYTPQKNTSQQVVACQYFTTAVYDLDEPMQIDYADLDSFVVLIGLQGQATVTVGDNDGSTGTTVLHAGQTILLPATTTIVSVEGTIKFLETYV